MHSSSGVSERSSRNGTKVKTRTSSSVADSSSQSGTTASRIVMRTAIPKYGNFQVGRKKPKEGNTSSDTGGVREVEVNLSHLNKPSGRITGSMAPIVVGHKTNEALKARHDTEQTSVKNHPRKSLDLMVTNSGQTASAREKPVTLPVSTSSTVAHIEHLRKDTTIQQSSTKNGKDRPISVVDPIQNTCSQQVIQTPPTSTADNQIPSVDTSYTTNNNIFLEQWTKAASEAMCLKEENKSLKTQLEVQLQVNKELKRLLVASVGDDLCQRVETLIRDKAQLSADLGDFAKKMTEDYENLDKVSIQADMWRSKYLASRLMTDELAKSKAYYGVHYQESQRVLQEVLMERHELRTNLTESYRCLQQVRDAFDPLNTHKSSNLQSSNVIDLAKTIQNLAETIRFRLLPPGPVFNSAPFVTDSLVWSDNLTKGESLAEELLSRKVETDMGSFTQSSAATAPVPFKIDRYHPQMCFDNLTLNCCGECKGEIKVI